MLRDDECALRCRRAQRRCNALVENARAFDTIPKRFVCASLTDCFGRKIKKARGHAPRLLRCYLFFFAVLRRAVPVFFAVVFFAAAVLRFAGFFLFATAMISLLRAGWLSKRHSSYIRSSLHTYRI